MFKRTEAIEKLRAGIQKIASEESFKAFLERRRLFRNYSLRNWLLIYSQCPEASLVAGFRTWQQLGRFVKKGEHGIQILAPVVRKWTEKNEAGELVERKSLWFRAVYVFDVTQTGGKELMAPPAPKILEGAAPASLFQRLAAWVESHGIRVLLEAPGTQGANGEYSPAEKCIRIRPTLPGLQQLKTLCHEAAHWMLKHGEIEISRDVAETEAESAAYLIMSELGLDSAEYSFAYVAGWSLGDATMLDASLGRIEKAADAIAAAVKPATSTSSAPVLAEAIAA